MAEEALTRRGDGSVNVPTTQMEWADWVSATATRNSIARDHLLDWLDLYGVSHGFTRDDSGQDHDERIEFAPFLYEKGAAFEAAVATHLGSRCEMVTVGSDYTDIRDLGKAQETFAAMREGTPVIYHGVLRDPESRTYGQPDFLVRSDTLTDLFPGSINAEAAARPAPDLTGQAWHYVVVDAKFTTLHLQVSGQLGNDGSSPAYKAQLAIYSRALSRTQGYPPSQAFILGRGWQQGSGARLQRGFNAMERLGPVSMDADLYQRVDMATGWIRRVRAEGAAWTPLPRPSVAELWPNVTATNDFPWHEAKTQIADELSELTMLWQVGFDKRNEAHRKGVTSWKDPGCTPEMVGVTGPSQGPKLEAILGINHDSQGPPVRPDRISSALGIWRAGTVPEFYVDFETVNDLADDFSSFPDRGGQPLIFMIGCGHVEQDQWVFENFVAERLLEPDEAAIIDAWLEHMKRIAERLGSGSEPLVYHWSRAETSVLETAYNSAKERHPEKDWPIPRWFDFMSEVVRREPVVIRGALGFGLKTVAKAFYGHGLIQTSWADSPLDGRGAMVGAWWCDGEAERRGITLADLELMEGIRRYNEVDCRVMMEIMMYLRRNH